jgi:hypothetical protein
VGMSEAGRENTRAADDDKDSANRATHRDLRNRRFGENGLRLQE